MDLGGFDADNQGCALELGLLVDRVPVDRILLVIDDSTDVPLLRRVLEESWSRMDAASPNRDGGRGPLTVVKAPLVGLPPGDQQRAERVEREELAVFQLMLERAASAHPFEGLGSERPGQLSGRHLPGETGGLTRPE